MKINMKDVIIGYQQILKGLFGLAVLMPGLTVIVMAATYAVKFFCWLVLKIW